MVIQVLSDASGCVIMLWEVISMNKITDTTRVANSAVEKFRRLRMSANITYN